MARGPAEAEVHGTCVRIGDAGVLLRGGPGSGKSDLALRLIEDGARLVADDRVRLRRAGGRILASAPPALAGLLEVRGLGIVRLAPARTAAEAPLALVADLVAPGAALERLPEPATTAVLDAALPLLRIAPHEATAAAKLRLAVGRGPGSIMSPR
ncbi:MAG TPA: HPr kinase/phosphatase C-terminal domain-containing protein [Alphaproteobacteria bacterium]|jgi:serine kinase of HPr protein (carbohydrate metabolism regulator)